MFYVVFRIRSTVINKMAQTKPHLWVLILKFWRVNKSCLRGKLGLIDVVDALWKQVWDVGDRFEMSMTDFYIGKVTNVMIHCHHLKTIIITRVHRTANRRVHCLLVRTVRWSLGLAQNMFPKDLVFTFLPYVLSFYYDYDSFCYSCILDKTNS